MIDQYIPKLSLASKRWVRFAGLLLALALFCWILFKLRTVFSPLLVGLAIAYVLNPVVTWFERALRVPRLRTVIVVFVLFTIVVGVGGGYVVSRAVFQVEQLARNLGDYTDSVGEWFGTLQQAFAGEAPAGEGPSPTTTQAADDEENWWQFAGPLVREHGIAAARTLVNHTLTVMSTMVGLISLFVLIPLFTFFFLWRFNELVRSVHEHLPAAYRDHIVRIVVTIDDAVANFFRGRLIVCLIVGTLTAIGWTVVGVPYGLLLGLLAGTLNLVPFMSLLALPPALLLAYAGAAQAGAPWLWPVVLAMGVYALVQALESFVLSPMIEGKSSGLHPLAIVVAIMIGAQLAGLLGMLLAIPIASTLKTFAAELLLPEIRRMAADQDPDVKGGD